LTSEQFVIDGFNDVKTFIQYLSAKVKKINSTYNVEQADKEYLYLVRMITIV